MSKARKASNQLQPFPHSAKTINALWSSNKKVRKSRSAWHYMQRRTARLASQSVLQKKIILLCHFLRRRRLQKSLKQL